MPAWNFKDLSGFKSGRLVVLNPEGNYEKDNCRWLSKTDNARHRNKNYKQSIDKGKIGVNIETIVEDL